MSAFNAFIRKPLSDIVIIDILEILIQHVQNGLIFIFIHSSSYFFIYFLSVVMNKKK